MPGTNVTERLDTIDAGFKTQSTRLDGIDSELKTHFKLLNTIVKQIGLIRDDIKDLRGIATLLTYHDKEIERVKTHVGLDD